MQRIALLGALALCSLVSLAQGQAMQGNPFDIPTNATAADENMLQFETAVVGPTSVYLRQVNFEVGANLGSYPYTKNNMDGLGNFWTTMDGIGALVIDVRVGQNLTTDQLRTAGAVLNGYTLNFNVTYVNQHTDVDIVHAHGILGNYLFDGVPLLSALPIQPGASATYQYQIDTRTNSGTYLIHSHWGMNHVQGMSAPLLILADVDASHPNATVLNDLNTQDVLFYIEDWCLVYTNADDVDTTGDSTVFAPRITDRSICQNPLLTYRAVWGEWNDNKKATFTQGSDPEINMCEVPTIAMEFGFSYFFANDRSYDDPQQVKVYPGSNVRLRIINAGRMTNFRISMPPPFNQTAMVIAVDGHYIEPVHLSQFWLGSSQRIDVLLKIPATPDVFPILAYSEGPSPNTTGNPLFEFSNVFGIVLYSTTDYITPVLIKDRVAGIGMLSQHQSVLVAQEMAFKAWPSDLPTAGITGSKNFDVHLTGYNGIMGINAVSYQLPPIIPLDNFKRNPNAMKISKNQRICVELTNYNWDVHPIHLHGHSFQVVQINDTAFSGAIRDTVLVPAGECNRVKICFNSDNAWGGVHALHCHMAIHEMAGMFTTFEYDGYTPLAITSLVSPGGNGAAGSCSNAGVYASIVLGILLAVALTALFCMFKQVGFRKGFKLYNVRFEDTAPAKEGAQVASL